MNTSGFSLLELLIVMALAAILTAAAYPSYSHHLIKARRNQAQISLLQLAARLEAYYDRENTYQNASLPLLGVNPYTDDNHSYELHILTASNSAYTINAVPQGRQTQDKACQTLSLNESGEESSSGSMKSAFCWQ